MVAFPGTVHNCKGKKNNWIGKNNFTLVSGMTDFYHIGTMSRLYETLRNRDIVDPTLRSLCGVVGRADSTPIEIQPLRGCQKISRILN